MPERRDAIRTLSIEWKLPIVGGLLLLLAIAAVLWAGYLNVRQSSEQVAVDRLPDVVGQLVQSLKRSAEGLNRSAQRLASDSAIRRQLTEGTLAADSLALKSLAAARQRDTTIIGLELHDLTGRVLLNSGIDNSRLPNLAPEDLPHSDGGVDSARVGRFQAIGDTVVFPTIAPVRSGGALAGYLVEWRALAGDTNSRARTARLIGFDATVYIGSARGAWSDQVTRVAPPPVDSSKLKGSMRYTRDGVGRRFANAAPVPNTPWLVLVEFPEQVILAPARRFLMQVTVIALVVFAVGLLAAWGFSRHLTSPLRRLTAAAGAIAQGRHPVTVPIEREDELGRLAAAFNHMVTRVEAESAARGASEEQWRQLFDNNPHPMWVYALDNHGFLAVNDAAVRQYGWTREQFLAMSIEAVRPPDEAPTLPDPGTARDGENRSSSGRHRRRDGTTFEVEVNSHVTTFSGRAARLILAQDVSQRAALETQLRQAQKMEAVGRLAGGVAHDFNNILLVISAYAEMMRDGLTADAPAQRDVQEMIDAVGRGRSLTRQLLAFSRQQVLQPTILDPNVAVKELDVMLRRLIGEHIEVVVRLAPDAGHVRADPGQLQQVLLNLAVNARDAMPTGGRLTVTTSNTEVDESSRALHGLPMSGRFVVIAVIDNGIGMTAATRARVFEPFFTTKAPGKGTGLGLATVYGIVTQTGGAVTVYSEPGRGTTFRVYLPIIEDSSTSDIIDERPARPGGAETILLVEDEVAVRIAAASMLRRLGYKVLVAENAEEALSLAGSTGTPIDLVISDVVMPRMDGPTLVRRLRERYPELNALLMSGYTGETIVGRGALDPSIGFLEKPFSVDDLATKVRECIDMRNGHHDPAAVVTA